MGVSVTSTEFGRTVPPGFLGLALEYKSVPGFIGRDPKAPNSVFVQLIANITPGQRPVIRIGGESTDRTWWPVPHMNQPFGITNTLTASWMTSARALADKTGARLILGLNLEANRLKITQTEANQLVSGIGRKRIAAFELGNEPELYAVVPWYELDHETVVPWFLPRHGTPVLARRPGYNLKTFIGEFARFRKVLPNVPLDGPSTGNPYWLSGLGQFFSTGSPLSSVTFHRYGLNGCVKNPSSPAYPSVAHMLTTYASRGIMDGVEPSILLAHNRGVGFRMDEMNSVTCSGKPGVSNTFASALWVLDALFEMADRGVDGVNIHTYPGNANGLFDFNRSGSQWYGTVHPEYYGLLMFEQAASPGTRLLKISAPSGGDIRVWATRAPGGNDHVVLINDSLSAAHTVSVRAPRGSGIGNLERLQAPSAYATSGVTLAGLTFGSTTTGLLSGTPQTTPVKQGGGSYSVTVPPASAAMLSWKAG